MYLHLRESTFRIDKVVAITKLTLPATMQTPEYYVVAVYLDGVDQPLIHTYESLEERDEVFSEIREALDEYTTNCSESTN